MKKHKRYAAILAAYLFLLPLLFGTSPKALFHRYQVTANIIRPAGGPLRDFTVVLEGKRAQDTLYRRMVQEYGSPYPVSGISDSLGYAFLLVTTYSPMDSLRVAVISPDHPAARGTPFAVAEVTPTAEYGYGSSSGGCNSCTEAVEGPRTIDGYFYGYTQKQVTVPW